MPFGGGARICIGNHFAMLEAQLLLASWVHKLRFELAQSQALSFQPLLRLRPRDDIRMFDSRRDEDRYAVGNSGLRQHEAVMNI